MPKQTMPMPVPSACQPRYQQPQVPSNAVQTQAGYSERRQPQLTYVHTQPHPDIRFNNYRVSNAQNAVQTQAGYSERHQPQHTYVYTQPHPDIRFNNYRVSNAQSSHKDLLSSQRFQHSSHWAAQVQHRSGSRPHLFLFELMIYSYILMSLALIAVGMG